MEAKPNKNVAQQAPTTGLARVVTYLNKVVDPLTGIVGVTIASIMLAVMMFLTFFDVAGRFLISKPINGSLEITEFLMALLISFGLGYCALRKGHIRVDLVMQYTSRKANQWFDIFAYGISCIFYIFIAWQAWLDGMIVSSSKLTSAVLHIPAYPFIFLLSVGAAFVTLVFLRDFLKSIEEVSK